LFAASEWEIFRCGKDGELEGLGIMGESAAVGSDGVVIFARDGEILRCGGESAPAEIPTQADVLSRGVTYSRRRRAERQARFDKPVVRISKGAALQTSSRGGAIRG
jgi:hypothetical protein